MKRVLAALFLIAVPLLIVSPERALSQRPRLGKPQQGNARGEFTFTRVAYPSGYYRQSWTTDWPKADEQFILGLRGWARSRLDISNDPTTVKIEDPQIFTYPFLYIVEPGYMDINEKEAIILREYLARGGFLMLDDFWGEREWSNVVEQMRMILPDTPMQELPLTHPVFHCYFDIEEVVQVPNYHNYVYRHQTSEKDGIVPHYHALLDESGRILVFIARNADNGDAWEWIEQPDYPLKYGLAAYRLGMNLIVYSMTH